MVTYGGLWLMQRRRGMFHSKEKANEHFSYVGDCAFKCVRLWHGPGGFLVRKMLLYGTTVSKASHSCKSASHRRNRRYFDGFTVTPIVKKNYLKYRTTPRQYRTYLISGTAGKWTS